MVLINGIKYACERCIRGHRVTTCNHTDQPLMMIKPKGRPSTTCTYCKEIRKNKAANPPGNCTCGRLEKKRIAQKAKEEARVQAKELANRNCTCGTDIPCSVHTTKRHSKRSISLRKNNNKSRTPGHFPKVSSSTSLDSNFLSAGSILSDSSNHLSSSFLDSDVLSGKITKDYHHVPSLASISSMHSSNSLDQNISTPQSPPLGAMQFNFITGGYSNTPSIHNSRNWENMTFNNGTSSQIDLNLLSNTTAVPASGSINNNNNNTMNNIHTSSMKDSIPNNRTRSSLASPPSRTNVGEVIVPLEEFVPPDINSVGKVTDNAPYLNDWSLNGDGRSYIDNVSHSASRKSSIVPSVTSNEIDEYSINTNQFSKPCIDRNFQSSNGLLDMFLDSSSISTLSKANTLLQDKGTQNPNLIDTNILQNDRNHNSDYFMTNDQMDTTKNLRNKEGLRSVEVLSITPSFMDIPENEQSMNKRAQQQQQLQQQRGIPISTNTRDALNGSFSISSRQRSSSIDRNYKLSKGSINNNDNNTINPLVVNSYNDNFDLNSNNNNYNNPMQSYSSNNANDVMDTQTINSITSNGNVHPSEPSPISSMQFSSPPSQLLSEQGFADLDNFMSTL